jgi:hypothetical protein
MPTKISVVQLMDHGISAAPVAAFSPVASMTAAPVLLPGEAEAEVLKAAKNVAAIRDVRLAGAVKAVLGVKNSAEFAAAMIKARYDALGGAKGFLGAAENAVTVCPDGVGYFQHFKGGSIYYHPYAGAHEVHGLIRAKWAAMGWERSFLGYPRTDETTGNDSKREGRYNHFQGGSIYWHPASGAHEVHGAIRAKYLELGAEASFLGYPTTDETATPDTVGRFNHFQAGSIYWTPRTWAHEVHGLIRALWAQNGWERNPQLGYPITDELVPHRGIGYTRVPPIRKPLEHLPIDVVRLPDEQPSPTIAASAVALRASALTTMATPATPVVRTAPTTAALATATPLRTAAVTPTRTIVPTAALDPRPVAARPGAIPEIVVRPPIIINPVANHTGQSQDRYSDFENGVLFWKRGASAATALSPRATAPNGAKMAWTGAEIAGVAGTKIRQSLGAFPGGTVVGVNFVGTTNYSFDGAGVHNRAHRLHVVLQGMRMVGFAPVPAIATIEVQAEISFDPVDREVVGYLSRWFIASSQGDFLGGGSLARAVQQRLDPALWQQFLVADVPGTVEDPIAVLSVKTQADGDVVVYFEP